MKPSTKIGIAAVTVLVLGVVVAGTAAAASEDASPNKGKGLTETGVRNGIRYEGCSHFELEDYDAVKAWAMANKWKFAKWVLRLDEVRANPEAAVTEALALMFPECSWPPPPETTFGPERVGWSTAMEAAKQAVAGLDMAGPGLSAPASRQAFTNTLVNALSFALQKRAAPR